MAIYCCAVSVALGRARGAKPGQRCWLPWDQNLWGCAGALHGALWGAWECCPIPAPLHPRPEDPALQLLPEAAHVPPVHRPRPARQPRGGHRLVSARAHAAAGSMGFLPPAVGIGTLTKLPKLEAPAQPPGWVWGYFVAWSRSFPSSVWLSVAFRHSGSSVTPGHHHANIF